MPSPFPGMDPYLESRWGDVHARLVLYAADQLQFLLPPDLRARVQERVFLELPDGGLWSSYPDVRVVERPRRSPEVLSAGNTAVAEPLVVHFPDEPVTETFVEIREAGTGARIVTVIEFLSPSNKRWGSGRKQYLKKCRECRQAGVSFVEVNLLRAGPRAVMIPPESVPPSHRTHYQAYIRRGWNPSAVEIYRLALRERLPALPVPLRETDPAVPLDLQVLLEQCYRLGAYDDLDYAADAVPPLSGDDALWVDALLREVGIRK